MLKSLRFLDFIREFILFSVVLTVFIIGSSSAQITLIWIITILSIVAWIDAAANYQTKKIRYTKAKTTFEVYTLILLSTIFVYFGHWIIGTFILFSNLIFIISCVEDNAKKEE